MAKIIPDREIKFLIYSTFNFANGKINPFLICNDFRISFKPTDKFIGTNYYNRIGVNFYKIKEHLKEIISINKSLVISTDNIQRLEIIKLVCHELSHSAHCRYLMEKNLDNDKVVQVYTNLWLYDNIEKLFSNIGFTFNKYIKKWLILEANNLVLIPRNIYLKDYTDELEQIDLVKLKRFDDENFIPLTKDNINLDLSATFSNKFGIDIYKLYTPDSTKHVLYLYKDIEKTQKAVLMGNNINPMRLYSFIRYLLSKDVYSNTELKYDENSYSIVPQQKTKIIF